MLNALLLQKQYHIYIFIFLIHFADTTNFSIDLMPEFLQWKVIEE